MATVIETRCKIVYLGTEGYSEGYVWLTDEEYAIVEKVLDPSNWEDTYIDKWSGGAMIEKLED